MAMHPTDADGLLRPEKGFRSPMTKVTDYFR